MRSGSRDASGRTFLRYPRGRLLAVIDDSTEAAKAVDALVAAGFAPATVEAFTGADHAPTFDGTGAAHGVSGRLRRVVEFVMMDQAPDLAWYEAALHEGRSVISVQVGRRASVRQAVDILRVHGAHFVNHFGLLETEEIERWRGPDPELPDYLIR